MKEEIIEDNEKQLKVNCSFKIASPKAKCEKVIQDSERREENCHFSLSMKCQRTRRREETVE